ncbi:hypothetical protein [Daejeonella sp. H1SJ63]|uniref:hypothetical protein n=1 Tax=Daejeonella sp. H1SJ63 TaxID=3034145 RepID=UPI0023EBEB98|nr:hypothetical protein [Daejeonella sp. H1SJ63]
MGQSPDQLRYYDLRNEPFYFVERKEQKGIFEGWKMYLKNFPTAASLSVELRGSFATLQTVSAAIRDDSAPGTFFQPSSLPTCHPERSEGTSLV